MMVSVKSIPVELNDQTLELIAKFDENLSLINLTDLGEQIKDFLNSSGKDLSEMAEWLFEAPWEKSIANNVVYAVMALVFGYDYFAARYYEESLDESVLASQEETKIKEMALDYYSTCNEPYDNDSRYQLLKELQRETEAVKFLLEEQYNNQLEYDYSIKMPHEAYDAKMGSLRKDLESIEKECKLKKCIVDSFDKAFDGDAESQFSIYKCFFELGDYDSALYWLKLAALCGDSRACQLYAHYCFNGLHVVEDKCEAFRFYNKATASLEGDFSWEYNYCRFHGIGIEPEKTNQLFETIYPEMVKARQFYEKGDTSDAIEILFDNFDHLKEDPNGDYLQIYLDCANKPIYNDKAEKMKELTSVCERLLVNQK